MSANIGHQCRADGCRSEAYSSYNPRVVGTPIYCRKHGSNITSKRRYVVPQFRINGSPETDDKTQCKRRGCFTYKDRKYPYCILHADDAAAFNKYAKETHQHKNKYDENATMFFSYILKLNDNTFYAGHTRDLRERLYEHRNNLSVSTANKTPKLVYFSTHGTRDKAATHEATLKKTIDKHPRSIIKMILQMQSFASELDFS